MLGDSAAFSGFSAPDIDAEKRFYGETLGLDVSNVGGGLRISFASGGSVFIYPKETHEPASFTVLNFPVRDLEGTVDALVEKGIEFERYEGFGQDERGIADPPAGAGGPRIAWFKDPAGNICAVMTEPS